MKRLHVQDEITDYLMREDTKDHLDGSTLVLYVPKLIPDQQGNYPPKWLLHNAKQTFTDALNNMEDAEWRTHLRIGDTISASDLKLRNIALVPIRVIKRGSISIDEFNAYMQTEVRYELISKKSRPDESSLETISVSSHSSNHDDSDDTEESDDSEEEDDDSSDGDDDDSDDSEEEDDDDSDEDSE